MLYVLVVGMKLLLLLLLLFFLLLLLLLLQSALNPLMGFGLFYDFVPQSSIFTFLSPLKGNGIDILY